MAQILNKKAAAVFLFTSLMVMATVNFSSGHTTQEGDYTACHNQRLQTYRDYSITCKDSGRNGRNILVPLSETHQLGADV
uniref:Uncharacterized protein n=1 Tax=Oryza rufipogon TaxID=4529 RepID=A0A679BE12_ORYRU|nr:hypothetical protein [Oryza rufipogon]